MPGDKKTNDQDTAERWPQLMSAATVAEYIDVSERQVWKLAADGSLPAPVKIPGARSSRWRKKDIDAIIGKLKAA